MAKSRNHTLDILKLFASYMVVFVHVLFYGEFGIAVDALARFAVPLFFTVSGFYSYDITPRQIKKRILHTLRLLIVAVITYVLWQALLAFMRQGVQGVVQLWMQYSNFNSIVRLLVFNLSLSAAHLWYLYAILYVYILYYLATVFHVRKQVFITISLLLLTLNILLGEVLSIFKITVPFYFIRNFALTGIPFFGLGLLTQSYQQKLSNIPNRVIIIFLVSGVLESLTSRHFLGKNELYIGSILILFAITAIFIKYPSKAYPSPIVALTNCSTYIYIFHPIVSSVILRVYPFIHLHYNSSIPLQLIHPLIVCVASTFLGVYTSSNNVISSRNVN